MTSIRKKKEKPYKIWVKCKICKQKKEVRSSFQVYCVDCNPQKKVKKVDKNE